MNARVTTFLIWFFIIALPAQGMASVMRACCGDEGQSLTLGDTPTRHPNRNATFVHNAPLAHNHGAMLRFADTVDHDRPTASDITKHSYKHTVVFCNTGGHCCLDGAVLPTQVSLPMPTFGLLVEIQHLYIQRAGHIPDSPDRPPRNISA